MEFELRLISGNIQKLPYLDGFSIVFGETVVEAGGFPPPRGRGRVK